MKLLSFLEGIRSPALTAILRIITSFGEETVAMVVLCAIYWCISKRCAYRIGIACFLSGLTVQGMKISFRINRPWILYPGLNPVPSSLPQATGYSFPSGHTQSSAALFGSLGAYIKQKPMKALCLLLLLLVAFSRMYLGVHTLLDVGVSLMISLIFIIAAPALTATCSGNKKKELILSLFMVMFAITVLIIAYVLLYNGKIEIEQMSDSLKAAGAGVGFATGMYIERVYIQFPVSTNSKFWQIIKFIMGFAGVFVLKEGLKLIIGTGLAADTVRYFLMLIWVTAVFPIIIKRLFA